MLRFDVNTECIILHSDTQINTSIRHTLIAVSTVHMWMSQMSLVTKASKIKITVGYLLEYSSSATLYNLENAS